jgi:hypothetical protein
MSEKSRDDLRPLWLAVLVGAAAVGAMVFLLTGCATGGPKWAADSQRATVTHHGWTIDASFDNAGQPARVVLEGPPGYNINNGWSVDIDRTEGGRQAVILERVP